MYEYQTELSGMLTFGHSFGIIHLSNQID